MKKYYNEAEIKKMLDDLTVICDTREQVNGHITEWLNKKKIPYKTRKLDTGDYSAMLGDFTLENDVAIEKKNGLDEIAGNFTHDRKRFTDEFIRAKADGIKMHLIIENASWEDVFSHNYRSKLESKALAASLLSWLARYDVTVTFCRPCDTAQIIYGILYYSAREALKKGQVQV